MTNSFENVALPLIELDNWPSNEPKRFLPSIEIERHEWIKDFIARFPTCFEYSPNLDGLLFYPNGNSPRPLRGKGTALKEEMVG